MQPILLVLHVLAGIAIVALVLMQHGRGADAGASFGAGASQTMFGSQGSTPFLVKVTMILAAVFFITSISLSYMVSDSKPSSVVLELDNKNVESGQ